MTHKIENIKRKFVNFSKSSLHSFCKYNDLEATNGVNYGLVTQIHVNNTLIMRKKLKKITKLKKKKKKKKKIVDFFKN